MDNNSLFQRIKKVQLPLGKYAFFGSVPLGVRGLRDCHDIDIVVTKDLWNELKKNWEMRKIPRGSQYLWNDGIELWKEWKPGQWNIQKLIDEAEIINGFPFVKLEYVIEWKRQYGREKDLKDIEIAEKFLRAS